MVRRWVGIIALLSGCVSLNILVWSETLFSVIIITSIAATLFFAGLWVALLLLAAAKNTHKNNRAVSGLNAVVSSVVFLGICIMIYVFTQGWDVSWDLTREGRRELAPQTIQVLQSMTQEVTVSCLFLNVDDELVVIARDKTLRFLEQCQKYTDLLKVELLDPQIEQGRLKAMGISHVSTQGTIIISSDGGKPLPISLSGGSPRLEERDFTNTLIKLLRDFQPTVYFLTGHGERDLSNQNAQDGASMLSNMLRDEAYQVRQCAIRIGNPEVPADCDVLVINNLASDIHPEELRAIKEYLDRGGRLMVLLDPWLQVVNATSEHFRPWLKDNYGIQIGSDVLVSDQRPDKTTVELSSDNTYFAGIEQGRMDYRGSFHASHPVTRGYQTMLWPVGRTVGKAENVPDTVVVTELLRTTPDYWAETDIAGFFKSGIAVQNDNEEQGPLPVAVAAVAVSGEPVQAGEQPPKARIIVVGDAYLATNEFLANPSGHFNFLLNAFAWLTESEELVAIRPSGKEDPPLILSGPQKRAITWVSSVLTLQLVVIAGMVVFALRRKNQ